LGVVFPSSVDGHPVIVRSRATCADILGNAIDNRLWGVRSAKRMQKGNQSRSEVLILFDPVGVWMSLFNGRSLVKSTRVSALDVFRQELFSSLYNNAIYLMINSIVTAIFGFVFWNLMARRFAPSTVGLGSAILAASTLISSFGHLGLGTGCVLFVPQVGGKARQLVNSALLVSGVATVLASVVYLIGVDIWSPALSFVAENFFLAAGFVVLTAVMTVANLSDSAFIARKSSKYVLWRNLIISLTRIPLPLVVFFGLGGYGIFLGNGLAVTFSLVIVLVVYIPKVYASSSSERSANLGLVRQILPFSFGNYLSRVFSGSIGSIFTIMVFDLGGPQYSAYLYMSWMIANLLSVIPSGLSMSLFAEGSHVRHVSTYDVQRALLLSYGLLIPACVAIYFFGPWILRIFGVTYATNGIPLLRWLVLASFPITINLIYNAVNQVREKMSIIMVQALVTTGLSVGLGYWFLGKMGLMGVGVGYFLGNLVVALVASRLLWKVMREGNRAVEDMDSAKG
jgi:O-antigen/teichoic acid export membrane protein